MINLQNPGNYSESETRGVWFRSSLVRWGHGASQILKKKPWIKGKKGIWWTVLKNKILIFKKKWASVA